MIGLLLRTLGALLLLATGTAATQQVEFEDPLFRRCISWMMTGSGGALIDNLCLERYAIPPPSLFMCAQKVQTGFVSENDREVCGVLYDEQARKIRAGYIR